MVRWLVSMILLSWVGFSATAPQSGMTGEVISILDKVESGVSMDPDGSPTERRSNVVGGDES